RSFLRDPLPRGVRSSAVSGPSQEPERGRASADARPLSLAPRLYRAQNDPRAAFPRPRVDLVPGLACSLRNAAADCSPGRLNRAQPALTTFPAERQDVQTRTRLRVPFSVTMRAVCRFGSQRRRVLLLAWLTLLPARGPFPQTE